MSRTIEILSFQNIYKVLKTCSACRKDFFDTLKSDDEKSVGFFHECDFVTEGRHRACYDKAITKNTRKEGTDMKIKLNSDQEVVSTVREGLKRTGGYCPCRLERTEATKCMCQEFKDQIADPNFEGYCHCMLYYKSLED